MKKVRYITIQEWMLDFDLKPAELMAFALIFGFSQDGRSTFRGSYEYLAHWLNVTTRTAGTILKTLTDRGLIEKIEKPQKGAIKSCEYRTIHEGKFFTRTEENFSPATEENFSHNNNSNDNKRKEKEKKGISLSDLMKQYGKR